MKKDCLIGYTGFIGSNIKDQRPFDLYINSSNLVDLKGQQLGTCYIAGISGLKHVANKYPEDDQARIELLIETLRTTTIERPILISTVDVLSDLAGQVSDLQLNDKAMNSYGENRLYAEKELLKIFPHLKIVRLPSVYGPHMTKGFVRDCLVPYPSMLTEDTITKLNAKLGDEVVSDCYVKDQYFYKYTGHKNDTLLDVLKTLNLTSLTFTNLDSMFQLYNVTHLVNDVENTTEQISHFLTEPVSARDIYKVLVDGPEPTSVYPPVTYDLKPYIRTKLEVLEELEKFKQKGVDTYGIK